MAHTPYGYIIRKGKAVADKIKALQVKALFGEYVTGASLQAAGAKAGIKKSHASLGRIIDAPCYMGDDFYPAIVGRSLWNKAQKERKRRADGLGRNKNYFAEDKNGISPFWGKIFCSECGQEYRRYAQKEKERWMCSRRTVGGKVYCTGPMICEDVFEDAFMRMVGKLNQQDIADRPIKKSVAIEKKYDDPFKQAEYAYLLTPIDDFDFQTEKLLNLLNAVPSEFDGEFMKQIIKRIEVPHSGDISFLLINDKIYREGINHGNNAADEDVGDTCKAENTDS